jgi:hypothetical protein
MKRILSVIAGVLITFGGLLLVVGGLALGLEALTSHAKQEMPQVIFYSSLGGINVLYGLFVIFRRRLRRKKA